MSYYIERRPIDAGRVSVTVGKLATAARIDREAAAFARRLAASPLVGKVASRALQDQLAALAPGRRVYLYIRDNPDRTRFVAVIDESVRGKNQYYGDGEFDIALATINEKRIDRDKLLEQAKRFDKSAEEYTRRAGELPGLVAQLNNLLPYLDTLERAAQTVSTYAPWSYNY